MENENRQRRERAEHNVDISAIRQRYRAERNSRLRDDALDQYREPEGNLARLQDDPYADPGFRREPVHDIVDVAVIGGGLGGLVVGARLREAGVENLRMIEKASDFGGTWYWNRYPGAQCDVESYIYLPLLEELGYLPTEKYAHAGEIFKHCQAIASHFDLYRGALLQTEVTAARWHNVDKRWQITTHRGDEIFARFVVMCPGTFQRPKLPGIPGIEDFQGHAFHTSRWDYHYTGGGESGNLTGLSDKRVGVIGTGATGVQVIPNVAKWAQQLIVFQRTPSTASVRNNNPTDPMWARRLEPGWQARRLANFTQAVSGMEPAEDMVHDEWTRIYPILMAPQRSTDGRLLPAPEAAAAAELADAKIMGHIRARVDESVRDPRTAALLKPYYRYLCKRPAFHDEFLDTFNRPNVRLVDTAGRGVEKITPTAVVADGQEYEIDCLIFATGFDTGAGYLHSAGYDIVGRGGRALSEYWASGMRTFHGFYTHGFPNYFFMGVTQTAITVNFSHVLVEQANHLAEVIGGALRSGTVQVETTAETEAEWVATIKSGLTPEVIRFRSECTPGYLNSEGKPDDSNGVLVGAYPAGPIAYFDLLARWRADGSHDGLVFTA